MTLFWVLVGAGIAWVVIAFFVILMMEINGWFWLVMLVFVAGVFAFGIPAVNIWFRLHPDPAWGRCINTELRNAPTRVDGKIESKPEWVCTLWG